ncbi:MAG: hypothetical protein NVSMB42_10400 [Herpetosiphon sp.]
MPTIQFEATSQPTIRIETVGGDLRVEGGTAARIEVRGDVQDDAVQHNGSEITIHRTAGDLTLRVPHSTHMVVHRVGGDADIKGITALELATVGGDLEVDDVAQVRIDVVSGDAELDLRQGQLIISRVGGDLEVHSAENLTVGIVGGNAELTNIGVVRAIDKVGGDLELEWNGRGEAVVNTKAGGDTQLKIGPDANLTLDAFAGGTIEGHGPGWQIEGNHGTLNAQFGAGESILHLHTGGDLEVKGGPVNASSVTSIGSGRPNWMGGFGGEMRNFAREMEAMARDLARDLRDVGRNAARDVARDLGRDILHEWTARPPRPGRAPGRPRINMRLNNREWHIDPEQVERIKNEATAAAAKGVARAQEAVIRAFNNMGVPAPAAPTEAPQSYTGNTVRINHEPTTAPSPTVTASAPPRPASADLEQERLAILRMVASGQIPPDAADAMLRSMEHPA